MAIRQIEGAQSFLPPQKKITEEESGEGDFQKILQKVHSDLQGSPPANPSPSVSGPEEISLHFLAAVQPMNPAGEVADDLSSLSQRAQSAKAAEEALDLLDHYCKAVADPGLSLKEIDPFLNSLKDKIDGLTRYSETLPLGDPLRKILSEINVLSRVEIEKFHRGDYMI